MDIDMGALRGLVREKEISFDLLVEAIEQALLIAYQRTEGHARSARVELDRRTGHVTVWAREEDVEGGGEPREYDDTPEGFGRIASTTAKQVILQRLREAADEQTFGEFTGKEGDIVSGVVQQGRNPGEVMVDLGKVEAVLPLHEQVPGERYEHGTRLRCYVVSVRRGPKGPQIVLSRSHPGLVRKLFALEAPEVADGSVDIAAVAREAGHRSKIAVRATRAGLNPKGACIGPMQAPFALSPARVARTAILLRCPASRATAGMSTLPSATSGASSANSLRTSPGWLRLSVICGPFSPRRTLTT